MFKMVKKIQNSGFKIVTGFTPPLRQGSRSDPGFVVIWCEKEKVGQNVEYNMFSRLKFSVDFNSEVRNAKF